MKGDQRGELTLKDILLESPHTVGMDQTLEYASARMAELGIRHLPVLDGGRLVDVVSERDIALLASVVPAERLGEFTVEEAMAGVPYCVDMETPIATVVGHMAARKVGSAIVTERGKIAGVFTTTDALRVLEMVLHGTMPEHPQPEAHSKAS
jgi:acetoin utilization protein AcuB